MDKNQIAYLCAVGITFAAVTGALVTHANRVKNRTPIEQPSENTLCPSASKHQEEEKTQSANTDDLLIL